MQQDLPALFRSLIQSEYDVSNAALIEEGCSMRRKTTLRANTLLSNTQEVAETLTNTGIEWEPVAWYDDAFVLTRDHEDALHALSLYETGKIYVQNLSSMIPPLVFNPQKQQDICDLCAAPGGKTSQLAALSDGKAYITACELHEPRAQKLDFTLQRQGVRNATVMRIDARNLDELFSFDGILVDAPCSGSGTLSCFNPKGLARFSEQLIQKSIKSQRALLKKGLEIVRPGGIVVYSTCSILHQENENIVSWALDQMNRKGTYELVDIDFPSFDTITQLPTTLDKTICICPDELYEGFFVAKIKRVQ